VCGALFRVQRGPREVHARRAPGPGWEGRGSREAGGGAGARGPVSRVDNGGGHAETRAATVLRASAALDDRACNMCDTLALALALAPSRVAKHSPGFLVRKSSGPLQLGMASACLPLFALLMHRSAASVLDSLSGIGRLSLRIGKDSGLDHFHVDLSVRTLHSANGQWNGPVVLGDSIRDRSRKSALPPILPTLLPLFYRNIPSLSHSAVSFPLSRKKEVRSISRARNYQQWRQSRRERRA